MVVFEHWSVREETLSVPELFARGGEEPCALLYGDGPLGRFLVRGDEPLALIAAPEEAINRFEREGPLPEILPDYIGLVAYEWVYGRERLLPAPHPAAFAFPHFRFVIYGRILVHDRLRGRTWEGRRSVVGAPPLVRRPISFKEGVFRARKTWDSDDAASYAAKVRAIRGEIAAGNVYQVNLTRQEEWTYEGDLRYFARALYAENPAPFSAFIAEPEFTVISSSPERFIRIAEGRLEARPIKGTAPRGANAAEDEELARRLLASDKNRAELAMIVDLLRNDLARVCRVPTVRVDAYPVLERYANVHHLVAMVTGEPRAGLKLAELLDAVFPGGSVTGCPKLAAMQVIRRLECAARAVYTGAIGWFSHDLAGLDFAIPIRTAWADACHLRFGVGGAVVWDSDPHEEYEETLHKGRSLVRCLSS